VCGGVVAALPYHDGLSGRDDPLPVRDGRGRRVCHRHLRALRQAQHSGVMGQEEVLPGRRQGPEVKDQLITNSQLTFRRQQIISFHSRFLLKASVIRLNCGLFSDL
jgi:hypothetical protein